MLSVGDNDRLLTKTTLWDSFSCIFGPVLWGFILNVYEFYLFQGGTTPTARGRNETFRCQNVKGEWAVVHNNWWSGLHTLVESFNESRSLVITSSGARIVQYLSVDSEVWQSFIFNHGSIIWGTLLKERSHFTVCTKFTPRYSCGSLGTPRVAPNPGMPELLSIFFSFLGWSTIS